jgi:hypothetical protein
MSTVGGFLYDIHGEAKVFLEFRGRWNTRAWVV